MSYFRRYQAGEHEAVWAELSAIGEQVRFPAISEDARAVAGETMRRVQHNLQMLQERLPGCGYRFNASTLTPSRPVYRPADSEDLLLLEQLERENGPLPLSLYAFYSVVGCVDFAQDYEQLVQWPDREEGAPYTELEMLGEFQPLSVSPLSFLMAHRHTATTGVEVPLMPDEAGNAFYSGDYYYTTLPNAHADAVIGTYDGGSELFIDYLRQSFQHGGFHGMPDPERKESRWIFPTLPCLAEITRDLLPI